MMSDEGPRSLLSEIQRINVASGGDVGVSAFHFQSGVRIGCRANEAFPLASTVKVAILVTLCEQVDAGLFDLATAVEVRPSDFMPSSTLSEKLPHAGISLSLANLAHLMIIDSDNTATDVVLRTIGGMAAVGKSLGQRGILGMYPCRSIAELYCDIWEIPQLEDPAASVLARLRSNPSTYRQWEKTLAQPDPAYTADPRDQGTAESMVELLRQLWCGQDLSSEMRDFAVETMRHTTTGGDRLQGRLSAGMEAIHKTGSCPGTVNDVGYIIGPGLDGAAAVAVFIKNTAHPCRGAQAIADLSRLLCDYFIVAR